MEMTGCLGFIIETSSPTGGRICKPRLILRDLGLGSGLLTGGGLICVLGLGSGLPTCRSSVGSSKVICSSEDDEP